MAWPGNPSNWNMGAGVDRAPPPPFGPSPSTSIPEFWQRWVQSRGWEDWASDPWGPGSHGHHAHGFGGRGRGRGHGRGHGGGPGGRRQRGGPDAHTPDASDNEAFPPEYITDDEVAAAVAESKMDKGKGKGKDQDKETDGHHERAEMEVDSPDTMARDELAAEDPPEEVPDESSGRRHRGCGHRGRPGRGGFGPQDHHHHGPRHSPRHRGSRQHGPPPPPFFGGFLGGPHGDHPGATPARPPFDFGPWAAALAGHPFAQRMRDYLERAQGAGHGNPEAGTSPGEEAGGGSFTPPVDLFEQPGRWVLHFAVPGAKKEDVGVNWDADRSLLSVSGIVHRPGDEEFLRGLVSGERRVGLFSREVRLPPAGQDVGSGKEEVNAEGIVAKMEDGVLAVTVPKVERGWTEVRKVDIS